MQRKLFIFLFFFLIFLFITPVLAQDEDETNILDWPQGISDQLGIPVFASKMLLCSIFLFMFTFPLMLIRRVNVLVASATVILVMGFLVGVGWMDYWFLLVIVLLIGGMWSMKMKGWLG